MATKRSNASCLKQFILLHVYPAVMLVKELVQLCSELYQKTNLGQN